MRQPLLNAQKLQIEQALVLAGNGHIFQLRVLVFTCIQFMLAGALSMSIESVFMMHPTEGKYPCRYVDPQVLPIPDTQENPQVSGSSDENVPLISEESVIMSESVIDESVIDESVNSTVEPQDESAGTRLLQEDIEPVYYHCKEKEYCNTDYNYEPSEQFGQMTQEFDLVCSRSIMSVVLITSFFLGGSIGSLYYGEQQEYRQGRYKIMLETLLLMGLVCCSTILAPSLYILSVSLFFCNFFQRGFFIASMILFFEISSENLQKIGPPILLVFWGLGEILLPLFNFIDWRGLLLIVIGFPLVCSALFMTFMKESPRFLLIKKQYDRAKEVITDISLINGRKMPDQWIFEDEVKINELKQKMAAIINDPQIDTTARSYNYSVLFRYNSTRVRTVCLLYLYIVFTFAQFLSGREIMAISKLGPLKTNLFIGLAETLGYLGSAYASLNNPRKETLKYVISLSAGFSFFVVIYPFLFVANASTDPDAYEHFNYSLMMMVLIMARICLSFGFSFLNVKKNPFIFNQVYVLEVFPTSIRHYALSFLVFLTEFVFIFFDSYTAFCHALGIHSSLGIGVALLAGQLTMQKLRETFNVPLKENLDEFQEDLLNNQVYA